MNTLILAGEAPDLKSLPKEVQDISNELQKLGQVHIQLEVNSFEDLLSVQSRYDLVWISTHSGAAGFQFGSLNVKPAQIAQLLSYVGARSLVLNSCFSAEHVMAIQLGANVEVVATIDPAGVDDSLAWVTGVYLARALIEEKGNLSRACRTASANGSLSYRYFPSPSSTLRSAGFGDSSSPSTSDTDNTLFRIRKALEGDTLTGQVGLVAMVISLQVNFDKFAKDTNERLLRLEAMERPVSLRIPLLLILLHISFFFLGLFLIWRM
jgi:hypothetical protein